MESASQAGVSFESAPSLRQLILPPFSFRIFRLTVRRTLHQSVVTIKVGPTQQPFIVHKERLCHYSSYFKAALTGPFKESAAAVVELPDQDVEVVEVVESWLYTQKLRQDDTKALGDRGLSHLIKAYVFGERFRMPSLRNAAVNAIAADKGRCAGLAEPEDIQYLYENSPSGSHLRRLLVAMFALNVGSEWFGSNLEEFPKDFVFEFTMFMLQKLESKRSEADVTPFDEDICQYHEHSDSTEMCGVKPNTGEKRKLDQIK